MDDAGAVIEGWAGMVTIMQSPWFLCLRVYVVSRLCANQIVLLLEWDL